MEAENSQVGNDIEFSYHLKADMKIDVEGYEPLVINGGIETIKKFRPFICFEDNGSSITNGITELSTHEILEQLEYKIHPLVYDNFLAVPLVKSNFKNGSGA
jgi:hypothetical protein